jgi:hypothetical protein
LGDKLYTNGRTLDNELDGDHGAGCAHAEAAGRHEVCACVGLGRCRLIAGPIGEVAVVGRAARIV